ncbi:MAG: hypothetical protein HY053_02695 [Proteobacteria bacterium]|nr:hypothetical protein [Pseudomonadota bacterium]
MDDSVTTRQFAKDAAQNTQWSPVTEKWLLFKANTTTLDAPSSNGRAIEQVEKGTAHVAAPGTDISIGVVNGENWYRYQRPYGTTKPHYVRASEAELRNP